MASFLLTVPLVAVADAAEEGSKIIRAMLIVGLVFIAVIALGELSRWASGRRRARRRTRRTIV
ncbi:MAG: hypothetical protein H0V40_10595 [Actinobacteria bacterium]|nr:hypothetical protein [Actinomycetota bacterium]